MGRRGPEDGKDDEGEELIEISLNYFAQTDAGTVCYFGETVDIFDEDGHVHTRRELAGRRPGERARHLHARQSARPGVGPAGSWRTLPEVAMDLAASRFRRSTSEGHVHDAMQVEECNPFEVPTAGHRAPV